MDGARSDLTIDSATGVDVALSIAGPGARSFAFLIDWHIRAILATAWYVVAALIYNGSWQVGAPLTPGARWFIYVIAPPAAIFFLYHPIWEIASRGLTPGKRFAGVRISARDGGAPGVGALLTRNVFRLIDSFPFAYAVGLVTTMLTRNSVRIGDLAAGTLLVYSHRDAALVRYRLESVHGTPIDANTAEAVAELLHRWQSLDQDSRHRLARALLADSASDDDSTLRTRLESLAGIVS
jgi:uncharacterized RDD family membrane protein YckC